MDDQAVTSSKPHYGVATFSVGIEHWSTGHEAYEGQGFRTSSASETARGRVVARMYDPADGRFISRDPLSFIDGMSLYAGYFASHLGNDPFGTSEDEWHHLFIQKERGGFRAWFTAAGLDIDAPEYGRFVKPGPHRRLSRLWQTEWEDFRRRFPNATREQMIGQMNGMLGDPRFAPMLDGAPVTTVRYNRWRHMRTDAKDATSRLARASSSFGSRKCKCPTKKSGRAHTKLVGILGAASAVVAAHNLATGACIGEMHAVADKARALAKTCGGDPLERQATCFELLNSIVRLAECVGGDSTGIVLGGRHACLNL